MAEVALAPADVKARAFQSSGAAFERLRRAGSEGSVAEPGGFGRGQLEGVALIVVPAAKIDAVAFLAALGHSHHVDEELAAFLEFRGEEFDVGEMGDVV